MPPIGASLERVSTGFWLSRLTWPAWRKCWAHWVDRMK
ncbi:hypothetical protein C4K37_0899 [Pseudomonas chlororaphis subsp. piscium]|nr:hypothetical protein C4K37_0899 [Pseudomonas chlororaphis subsp. piscium]